MYCFLLFVSLTSPRPSGALSINIQTRSYMFILSAVIGLDIGPERPLGRGEATARPRPAYALPGQGHLCGGGRRRAVCGRRWRHPDSEGGRCLVDDGGETASCRSSRECSRGSSCGGTGQYEGQTRNRRVGLGVGELDSESQNQGGRIGLGLCVGKSEGLANTGHDETTLCCKPPAPIVGIPAGVDEHSWRV